MHEVDVISALSAHMAAMEKKMIETIARNQIAHAIHTPNLECNGCGANHLIGNCPLPTSSSTSTEQTPSINEEQVDQSKAPYDASQEKDLDTPHTKTTPHVKGYIPPIPFLQRLKKHKFDKQFEKFLEVFKKLQINIPFADTLAQMSSYTKFMKEILPNKMKLEKHETVMLTEECSAILQNKLPPKLKDPGSFTIFCTIGEVDFDKSLYDLGASINLITFSVYRRLG
ncbi:Uncharacterized protein Adt_23994 [Abeliophyllum distichum]|uniref:Reverse transcriptase domain-containing protein n=1 Tax=Abeliophyllum distichum TaxID=126358 RepID=A0ABD1SFN1_9LAMI